MKKIISVVIAVLIVIIPIEAFCWEGENGYEGGMSVADQFEAGDYQYKEVCYITGKPIIMEGTLTIKRNVRQDSIQSTYVYRLENADQDATLTRTFVYTTDKSVKENGQTVEQTGFSSRSKPTEVIRIGDTTYILNNVDFTRSKILDPKPAVDFYTGETWGIKEYRIGANGEDGTVTVESTGQFYGYDQYWGNAEAYTVYTVINCETVNGGIDTDSWGGTAVVNISSTQTKEHKYLENDPYQISFSGGYVETSENTSILEYNAQMPEFDQNGVSTDYAVSYQDNISLASHPKQSRLMVPDLQHLRGYWAEDEIKMLYSLEIIPGTGTDFNPQKYVSRREFAAMVIGAAPKVPEDPNLTTTRRTAASRRTTVEVSPFSDVSVDDGYYKYIKEASDRDMIFGVGDGLYDPYANITVADAISIIVRALGLEALAPEYPVTTFLDNDQIPSNAINAVAVAQRIGLDIGDDRGYLNPNSYMTNEEAAMLIYQLVEYMGSELVRDYKDRIFLY